MSTISHIHSHIQIQRYVSQEFYSDDVWSNVYKAIIYIWPSCFTFFQLNFYTAKRVLFQIRRINWLLSACPISDSVVMGTQQTFAAGINDWMEE